MPSVLAKALGERNQTIHEEQALFTLKRVAWEGDLVQVLERRNLSSFRVGPKLRNYGDLSNPTLQRVTH